MSEHENTRHEDIELKEDFSGLTEVSVKNNVPEPQKIDVSEAVAKAQSKIADESVPQSNTDGVDAGIDELAGPQLPGALAGRRIPRPEMIPPHLRGNAPRPSFWKTLLNRGLTVVAVIAVGLVVWWWWSKNNGTAGPIEMAGAAVNGVRKTVVEPIKKALKLPPLL